VWKQLTGESCAIEDLMAVDATACRFLDALRNCEADGVLGHETFDSKYGDKLK
jgi:hypothetical protein